jgi:hypothetical protein
VTATAVEKQENGSCTAQTSLAGIHEYWRTISWAFFLVNRVTFMAPYDFIKFMEANDGA